VPTWQQEQISDAICPDYLLMSSHAKPIHAISRSTLPRNHLKNINMNIDFVENPCYKMTRDRLVAKKLTLQYRPAYDRLLADNAAAEDT
jgi:hypothetical protein